MAMVYEIRSYRKTITGAPAKGGAVKLSEDWNDDWRRALALLGHVVVTEDLPPGTHLGLAGGTIVFPEVAAADPKVTQKRIDAARSDYDRVQARLENEQFLAKAPPEEIEKQRARAEELREEIERLEALL
jgi:hypothetical protein